MDTFFLSVDLFVDRPNDEPGTMPDFLRGSVPEPDAEEQAHDKDDEVADLEAACLVVY
jgi:hypothetical protein